YAEYLSRRHKIIRTFNSKLRPQELKVVAVDGNLNVIHRNNVQFDSELSEFSNIAVCTGGKEPTKLSVISIQEKVCMNFCR
uniref:Uncharacterized protein n=1 Tax=Oncorhynchus mykiss TaxID=8022 RepID=A0A8C7PTU3_ONCMY